MMAIVTVGVIVVPTECKWCPYRVLFPHYQQNTVRYYMYVGKVSILGTQLRYLTLPYLGI